MLTSTKCQKIEKKITINVIQHDGRLLYLRLFYNGAFSIVSKNDFDDQNLLLATVDVVKVYIDCTNLRDLKNIFIFFRFL
jgi:hypothetical protein